MATRQFMRLAFLLAAVAGCMDLGLEPVETNPDRWISFETTVDDMELHYKLPPRPHPLVRYILEMPADFSNTNLYERSVWKGAKSHEIRIFNFGYEYNPKDTYSLPRIEIWMFIGRTKHKIDNFSLGSQIFEEVEKKKADERIISCDLPKEKGKVITIGTNKWYYQINYEVINPEKPTRKISNLIGSELYARTINSNIYIRVVASYIRGIKDTEHHRYRELTRKVIKNIRVVRKEKPPTHRSPSIEETSKTRSPIRKAKNEKMPVNASPGNK